MKIHKLTEADVIKYSLQSAVKGMYHLPWVARHKGEIVFLEHGESDTQEVMIDKKFYYFLYWNYHLGYTGMQVIDRVTGEEVANCFIDDYIPEEFWDWNREDKLEFLRPSAFNN